jgi:hypothetical protein
MRSLRSRHKSAESCRLMADQFTCPPPIPLVADSGTSLLCNLYYVKMHYCRDLHCFDFIGCLFHGIYRWFFNFMRIIASKRSLVNFKRTSLVIMLTFSKLDKQARKDLVPPNLAINGYGYIIYEWRSNWYFHDSYLSESKLDKRLQEVKVLEPKVHPFVRPDRKETLSKRGILPGWILFSGGCFLVVKCYKSLSISSNSLFLCSSFIYCTTWDL